MGQPHIIAFAGSARRASFNRKLAAVAARGAEEAGATVTLLDLAEFPLPIYDGDLEEKSGLPANAVKLKELLGAGDGWIIASPEYNSAITPLLKNTIDWRSRAESDDELALSVYRGKVAVLLSASPGPYGGIRGLPCVRSILQNIGVTVLPGMRAVGNAHEAFDDDGSLRDPDLRKTITGLGRQLAEFLAKHKA